MHLAHVYLEKVDLPGNWEMIFELFHGDFNFDYTSRDSINLLLKQLEIVTFNKLREYRYNLPIYSKEGEHIGFMKRKFVHFYGMWHKTVNIGIVTNDGYLILQKRSERYDIGKNKFAFFGGHLLQGETYWDAARRELSEETGLEHSKIIQENFVQVGEEGEFIWPIDGIAPDEGENNKEFSTFYLYFLKGEINIHSQEEIDGEKEMVPIKIISLPDLVKEYEKDSRKFADGVDRVFKRKGMGEKLASIINERINRSI